MSKKILGLLLAICLVVGLLPLMTFAAVGPTDATVRFGFSTYTLSAYDTPIYFVNASRDAKDTAGNAFTAWGPTTTGATEQNYNAKFEWKTGEEAPTLTLRGFKFVERNVESGKLIGKVVEGEYTATGVEAYPVTFGTAVPMKVVITGEDSLIAGQFGITYKNDTTITSEGAAKLIMDNGAACITSNNTEGADLTINANLDLKKASYYNLAFGGAIIQTYKADLTINGGVISAIPANTNDSVAGIAARSGGDVIINGGTVTVDGVAGLSSTNGSLFANTGKVIINGGTVNATAQKALPIYGKTGIEINDGTVNITSPYYGMNVNPSDASAQIAINGGTVEITSVNGGFYKAPVLGANVTGVAGADADSAEAYDETKYNAKYVKLETAAAQPTQPTTETTAPTAAPTTAPSTEAPTTAPSTAPTAPVEVALPSEITVRVGFSNYKLTHYDKPVYSVNVSRDAKDVAGNAFTAWGQTSTGANEDNYNMKLVWKTGEDAPTLILKGFKFVEKNNATGKLIGKVVEGEYTDTVVQAYPITLPAGVPMNIIIAADSEIAGQFGITYKGNTTITSEGTAKLTINSVAGCIVSNDTNGAALTINANLDLTTNAYYNTAFGGAVIRSYGADLTINGGTIVCKNKADRSVAGIAAGGGGNVVINGGNVTAHGVAGESPTNGSIYAPSGKVIINGGTVAATAKEAVPVYALKGVEINGGEVNITSPYYGMNAGNADNPADIAINGGTVEIIANRAFYKAPILGANVDGVAGSSKDDTDFYDDTKYKESYVKLTYTAPSGSTPSNPSNPTSPSAPSGTTPGGTVNPGTGDSGVTMFVVMMLIGVFGIVATVTFSKKRAV